MVRACWHHVVVSDGHIVVVARGTGESSVELFTGSSRYSVAGLPDNLLDITATHSVETCCTLWTGMGVPTFPSSLPCTPTQLTKIHPAHSPLTQHGIPSTQLQSRTPPFPLSALVWLCWEGVENSLGMTMSMS